ncbi:MAG: TlpA family protein disulfide reductase [Lachnospiraceae bacterium]|nr:TlpA family protein disulfide reductase [Lachnospiraceae bacterium]
METVTDDCFGESRLTMLNIWATYCNPCLSEMPDLGAIAAAYDPAEFQMYGIISDVTAESEDAVIQEAMDLIEQTGAAYPHLLLNESLYINLVGAASAVPTTFFVNQKGEVLGYVVGARSKEVWEEVINELLEQNP